MVMYTCMISVPAVISNSVLKNMQKLRLVASIWSHMKRIQMMDGLYVYAYAYTIAY